MELDDNDDTPIKQELRVSSDNGEIKIEKEEAEIEETKDEEMKEEIDPKIEGKNIYNFTSS